MRIVLAVIVGYIVMAVAVFASFSLTYLALGTEAAFLPGTFEPSVTWITASFLLGFAAAMAGGFVAARVAPASTAPTALAALVLIVGFALAVPIVRNDSPTLPRLGEVSNVDAMQNTRQPRWVALVNPIVGAVGVLVGARLARRVK